MKDGNANLKDRVEEKVWFDVKRGEALMVVRVSLRLATSNQIKRSFQQKRTRTKQEVTYL